MKRKREPVSSSQAVPVVVRGALTSWPSLTWGEEGWRAALGQQEVTLRLGEEQPAYSHPTWEGCCQEVTARAEQLFQEVGRKEVVPAGMWAYWAYQHLPGLLPAAVLEQFSWAALGFPGRAGRESTLWVGTRGAHTPCHQDTYGSNLVAQVLGSKTWLLFPPSQGALLATGREPYEESSVYSTVNFSCLARNSRETLARLEGATPYRVTLRPGEVLYVPRHWWHFVTNEEFSVSVNTWLEHPGDSRARLEEALVRIQAASTAQQLPPRLQVQLLNPNERDLSVAGLEGLYSLAVTMARRLREEQEREEDTHFSSPDFGADFSPLTAEELVVPPDSSPSNSPPASSSWLGSSPSSGWLGSRSLQRPPVLAVYRAMTAQHVVQAAADELLANL